MTLLSKQLLQNRYQVKNIIKQGGMGTVYLAQDLRLETDVAVKEMTPQQDLDTQTLARMRQQFKQEAQVLSRLRHPNLVPVRDYFEEGGNTYLVMDYIQGKSLAELIADKGALTESEVLPWIKQLLLALAYCHQQGVIHRDIKPQNVIISSNGQAILVDFGLVKLWDTEKQHTRSVLRGIGTVAYMPPEQYHTPSSIDLTNTRLETPQARPRSRTVPLFSGNEQHTDVRSDLYSLGATMYHALTGKIPPTPTQRIADPVSFQTPRDLNGSISSATEVVISRAMELSVNNRFATAEEMAAALASMPHRSLPWRWLVLGASVVGILSLCLLLTTTSTFARVISVAFANPTTTSTVTSTLSPTPTPLPTSTPTPSSTSTNIPTITPSPTDTLNPTHTPTTTPAPTNTATSSPIPSTPTPTHTVTPTVTPTYRPTFTPTPPPLQQAGVFSDIYGYWESTKQDLCNEGIYHELFTYPTFFGWDYTGKIGEGEYMEVRIGPPGGPLITMGQAGETSTSVRLDLYHRDYRAETEQWNKYKYSWQVVHMAADRTTELASSQIGCFFVFDPWAAGNDNGDSPPLPPPPPTATATPPSPPQPIYPLGDFNYDCIVDNTDFYDYFQPSYVAYIDQTGPPGWVIADINRDGTVNIYDFTAFKDQMGKTCTYN